MSVRPARRTIAALLAGVAAACAACTPIAARDDDRAGAEDRQRATTEDAAALEYDPATRPLRIGEVAPDVALVDAGGRRIALPGHRDEVTVLTFVDRSGDGLDGELLARLARFTGSLAASIARETRTLCVDLGDPPSAPRVLPPVAAATDDASPPCTFIRPVTEESAVVAGAFGVAVWHSPDGAVRHTFNTVVLDRRGRLADQFPGLDGWSAMDLVAAVSLVAGR